MTNSYRDLEVWQKSMDFVVECYRVSGTFPTEELDGLTNELRQTATAISTNIAKGHGMLHTKEYLDQLSITKGSLRQLETLFQLAARLDYLDNSTLHSFLDRIADIDRMLKP